MRVSGVAVNMLGIRREYRNPNIKRVVVDGRGYAGKMKVTFLGDGKPVTNSEVQPDDPNPPTANFDLDAIVYGYLCEQDHLAVDDEAELADEAGDLVLGKTTMRPGKIEINRVLVAAGERGRFRFTLAHEIGHWVLHRAQVLAAADAPSLFGGITTTSLTTLNRTMTGPKPPPEEVQANRFAAALLINRRALQREVHARFGDLGIRDLLAETRGVPARERARRR